jgi:hypothetical protein
MNKTVKRVFMLVGLLVVIFIIWQLVFNKGGILRTGYNALANGVNAQWAKAAGDGQKVMPVWGENGDIADNNGQGFDIDTNK